MCIRDRTVTLNNCYLVGNNTWNGTSYYSNPDAPVDEDAYVRTGSLSANNCTIDRVGMEGGSFILAGCGTPGISTGSPTFTNHTSPSAFAVPNVPFVVGSCTNGISDIVLLPIKLTLFEARCVSGNIVLVWQTASEYKNDFFTIERSLDGKEYVPVGEVKGAGFSDQLRDYNFRDKFIFKGIVYYRLKTTDFDGNDSHTDPIAVYAGCDAGSYLPVSAHYNSQKDMIYFYTADADTAPFSMDIFDYSGRLFLHKDYGENTGNGMEELRLPNGIYFAVFKSLNSSEVVTVKLPVVR